MDKPANPDHPIHEILQRRWSPRAFSSRRVEPETLRCLLEAARWAPSSNNAQPWSFLVATQDDPGEFQRLLSCLREGNIRWVKQAPVLLISVARLNFEDSRQPNRHAFHDIGLAAANLTVQATAMGLVVHQMAGFFPEKVKELYAVPADHEPVTAIALGYPGDPATLPDDLRERESAMRTREPIGAFVFSGRWGQRSPLA
ncbi:MAG: nitroreductase family protein [Nitrospira sp.]|nr:nitroreductase family protein [Nitrospira sp.]